MSGSSARAWSSNNSYNKKNELEKGEKLNTLSDKK